jgi:hypothetical protein
MKIKRNIVECLENICRTFNFRRCFANSIAKIGTSDRIEGLKFAYQRKIFVSEFYCDGCVPLKMADGFVVHAENQHLRKRNIRK